MEGDVLGGGLRVDVGRSERTQDMKRLESILVFTAGALAFQGIVHLLLCV